MEPEMIDYRLEIVGGPYDGVDGLYWTVDEGHPVPERVFIGNCPGDASCGELDCDRRRRAHPAYWTSREDVPLATVAYERDTEFVKRIDRDGRTEWRGVAIYSMGGLGWAPALYAEECEELKAVA